MRKHNKFERTSKGSVFACGTCGRNTRMAGQGTDSHCFECWELAGWDNHVNDNGAESLTASVMAERDALLRKAVSRGGDEAAIKASCDYLWPTTTKPRVGFHTGLGGDELFPDFCLVKNRKPLTAEQRAKLDTHAVKEQPERVDGRKPKGMSWEDWDAYLATHSKAQPAAEAALPKPARTPSVRKANGMLDANHFAPLCGCPAKVVRRALRSQPKPFAIAKPAHGWVSPKEQEAAVVACVKAYLTKGRKVAAEPVKPTSKLAKAQATLATAKATLDKSVARQAKSADPQVDATLRAAFGKADKRAAKGLPPIKAKRARK